MSHAYLCGSALRVALELRNSQPQSVLRFCVLSGQKFFAFGSSLWRRFARCVARSVIVVAGKFASILICGLDYSSCVTHSHNLNSDTRNENVDQLFFHKQKCRNVFSRCGERRGCFFASPLHFTGSFSCPHSRGISGRGQAL